MRDGEDKRIPLYVINNFIKFDRKLYQFFGMKLGRPIPFKGVLYFLAFVVIELVWYFTPILGKLIHWIPPGILFVLPITFAWLLTDVGTENRSPIAFFRSFLFYHVRKIKRITYIRGKTIPKEKTHTFHTHYSCRIKRSTFKPKSHRYGGFVTYR
ncbi:TcpE family conjugal transfer membrane protein [Virgibacillus ainsalahensis]